MNLSEITGVIAKIIIASVTIGIWCAALFGCASSKNIEKSSGRYSIIYHHIYDTTKIVIAVTQSVQSHSSTATKSGKQINFGEGGGTYNEQTGEATNVSSVISDTETSSESDSIAQYREDITLERTRNDSLAQKISEYQSEISEERSRPKRTGYDRFCSWWFWITAILLLLKVACWICEKIPITAPYASITRKFVPFL